MTIHPLEILYLLGGIVTAIALVVVVRSRHRSHPVEIANLADDTVCDHLRPALELLQSRGYRVTRVGQNHPDLPLEIHTVPPPTLPPFDPAELFAALELAEPVFVSVRGVLYCKEDWCELHPKP